MITPGKSPVELFEESYKKAKEQFDALNVDEFFWHKLITCRTDLHTAFAQLQYIPPAEKVKLHNKIADAQLIILNIGS